MRYLFDDIFDAELSFCLIKVYDRFKYGIYTFSNRLIYQLVSFLKNTKKKHDACLFNARGYSCNIQFRSRSLTSKFVPDSQAMKNRKEVEKQFYTRTIHRFASSIIRFSNADHSSESRTSFGRAGFPKWTVVVVGHSASLKSI